MPSSLDEGVCVCVCISQSIGFDGDSPTAEVRAALRRILLTSDALRCREDYEFLDKYGKL
jgi:hypothetical protein